MIKFRKDSIIKSIFIILPALILFNFALEKRHEVSEQDLRIAEQFVKLATGEEKGYELLRELTNMGPRLSGSEGSMAAIDWAYNKMNELGLENVTKQPVMVPKWVRGTVERSRVIKSENFNNKNLNIAALGGTVGTPNGPISGQVLEVQSFQELKEKSKQAKGKIIFFNRPMDKTLYETFGAYGGAVSQRGGGASAAAEVGGIAALVRSMTMKDDNVPHTGGMGYQDGIKKVPAAAVGIHDADFLSNLLKSEPNIEVSLELSAKNHPDVQSYNVYADIKGSEFPNEIIVVGGHFDSWDKGVGAMDDGGGCLQALEVLDLFNRLGIKPKRTIRVVFFINEENGGRGGTEYAAFAANSDEKHIAAIESDRGVFTPRGFTTDAAPEVLAKMQSWLPALNKAKIEWVKNGGSGADVGKIKNAIARIGYYPDDARYFDYHHSDNDQFSAVSAREMELGTAAMAILTYMISEYGFDN